ncbi:MAG: cyclophilin-like family protein [Candidatus Bathyarchaeia archaeon]
MRLEVEYDKSSFVIEIDDQFSHAIHNKIPFTTNLNVWKEEIYFLTPIDIDVSGLCGYLKAKPGGLYYWPDERGFCIFYGISQPYSFVYPLGSYVGVLDDLRRIKDGVEANVKLHKIYEPYSDIVSKIEPLGFKVSTPMRDGERIIETVKNIEGERVAFRIYVESGLHIEGEPIFPRDYNPLTLRFIDKVKKLVDGSKYARLDLSEDEWITITGFISRDPDKIQEAISEMSRVYCEIIRRLLTDQI